MVDLKHVQRKIQQIHSLQFISYTFLDKLKKTFTQCIFVSQKCDKVLRIIYIHSKKINSNTNFKHFIDCWKIDYLKSYSLDKTEECCTIHLEVIESISVTRLSCKDSSHHVSRPHMCTNNCEQGKKKMLLVICKRDV